ncbi:MAG TPA: preprotein translocase subunit YajC [Burkholderiaceae bacterium]|nr:preprotein translocase subunit YajC [Burkholderiaceae bacterium]
MRLADLGPLPLSIIASLVVAVVLLAVRIFVMQRVQQRRQRENRQETERLKSLVAAYRSLAGSFTPATGDQRAQLEEALADVILFGSIRQVGLAAGCARELMAGGQVQYQPLIDDLRSDLRTQLGLEPIPARITLPAAGPARTSRPARPEGGGAGNRAGGGGGGGGFGGGAAGAGGLSAGLIAADSMDPNPPPG